MIDESSVVAVERDTMRYYDAEEGRESRALDSRRIAARDRFIDELQGRSRAGPVLEIGTGPGRDALALLDAKLEVIGLDLSPGHAARAASRGVTMTVASARALPFVSRSVAGLWSMSTLMHIPSVAIEGAMRDIARVLAPGAVLAIGVWGGPDVEHYGDAPAGAAAAPRRLFSRRSEARWRALLEITGRIDDFEVWDYGETEDAFQYHLAFVTAHA